MSLPNNIEDIFFDKKIYSTKNLSEDFYKYCVDKFEPYNINKKEVRELEVVLPAYVVFFSTLFNYEKSVKSSYIEIKNIINTNEKIRIRKDIKDFISYNNKTNILANLKNESWEHKKTDDVLKINNFVFKSCRESVSSSELIKSKKIKFYYINSIKLFNEYFKAEIRLRTTLKENEENNILLNYFNPKNTERKVDLEIELNHKLTELDETKFKKYFMNILQYTFGVSKENFYFNFSNPKKNLKTSMINLYELLTLDTTDCLFTDKIDGEYIHFYVKNSFCYITKNNIILELKCNVYEKLEFEGDGEFIYYKNKRIIFPFYIEEIKKNNKVKNFTTRKDSLLYIKKNIIKEYSVDNELSLQLKQNENISVFFEIKEMFGPYETKQEFLENFLKSYEQISNIPKDGLIIIKNNEIDKNIIEDFKFKKHNTIDIFTNLNINFKKNDILNFSLLFISFKKKEKNNRIVFEKNINNLYNINIVKGENYYYDYNLSMIIIYNETEKRYTVYPVTFISEYNIEQKYFKPRMDKTNKLYSSSIVVENKNSKTYYHGTYFGNGFEVIVKSNVIHNYKLYFNRDVLDKITKNEEACKLFLNNLKEKIEEYTAIEKKKINHQSKIDINSEEVLSEDSTDTEEDYIVEPLNSSVTWYKETDTNTRTVINHISNLNKSFGLFFGCSNMVNKESYKTVVSVYCGKGGDMGKFVNNDFLYVVGIDPDKKALRIFWKRRTEYVKNKAKIFELKTIKARLEDRKFLAKLYKIIPVNFTFDIIESQLGIQFSLCKETEEHIMNIFLKLVNRNKPPSTRVLISTNDKDNILKIHQEKNIKIGDTFKLKIDENFYIEFSVKDDKLSVFYPLSMNKPCEEYLMSKDYLIPLFEKYNFKLIETWCFNEILEEKSIYDNILKEFSNRKSTFKFIEKIKNIDIDIFDVKDIASTYRYYIFEYNNKF